MRVKRSVRRRVIALALPIAAVSISVLLAAPVGAVTAVQHQQGAQAGGNLNPATARQVLGAVDWGETYHFTSQCVLDEAAQRISDMGIKSINIALYDLYDNYNLGNCGFPTEDQQAQSGSLVEEAKLPQVRQVLNMPFNTYDLTTYSFVRPGWSTDFSYFYYEMTPQDCTAETQQFYDLSRYLLTTYRGTGKSFIFQNWEADWAVRNSYDPAAVPQAQVLSNLTQWFNCRQAGIDEARASVSSDAKVFQGCEVNLVVQAMEGKTSVLNDVIPKTDCDFVAYSSYDSIDGQANARHEANDPSLTWTPDLFRQALNYIYSKAPKPSAYVRNALGSNFKNVYVGEFGCPEVPDGTAPCMDVMRNVVNTALPWGARLAMFWEVYDNTNQGYWLIRSDGSLTPWYYYFSNLVRR